MIPVVVPILITDMVTVMITIVTVTITIVVFCTWLDDVTRRFEIDESLYGGVIVQHSGVQDARIEESSILYASGLTNRPRVC